MIKTAAHTQVPEDLLLKISEATSGLSGQDFILELTKKIPSLLGMRYCFVSECTNAEKTKMRTIAYADGKKLIDNIEYHTDESPCRMMMKGDPYFLPKGAQKIYKSATGMEAYAGAPIISPANGEILGHIAITNPQPVEQEINQTAALKIFAVILGVEFERIKTENELIQKNELLFNKLTDIELYQTTIENLYEAIYWVDDTGKIKLVNQNACILSGYKREELIGMSVFNLAPVINEEYWKTRWQKLKTEKNYTTETQHKHKKGHLYEVESSNHFIEFGGKEYLCAVVRDIRKKKMEEELLKVISEGTAGLTGMDYFREVAKFVTTTLNVRYALVTQCANEEKTRVRTVSYVDNNELLENVEYDLEGTPCEIVMKGKDYFCESELEKTFPKEKGIRSYLSVPIISPATGEVLGHIAAFDNVPMKKEQNQTHILKIFAARAGAEMDRLASLKKLEQLNEQLSISLQETEQRYRDLFEEAPIAYVHEGLDSKFIKANRAALRILGVKPEEVPYTYGKTMAPDTPDAQKRMEEAFASVGRGTDTSGVVLELRRKDNGQPIWIQWWSNPDTGGQFTRTMFIDITERVRMEQEQVRLQAQNQYLQEEIKHNHNFEEIISKSKDFHKVLQQIEQVASTDATVLIMGESGTGKELIARAVHNISNRSKRPLVKVNCATLPANLIESELFGHEKGAFTGAMERKIGRFELADGGTIFLDEIGELPIELQSKLLRVLQEGEFERLGNPRTMKVNVRVIAATNRDLQMAIDKKEFREDLFYRLNVFPVITPPLRDRKEDIPLLVTHFIRKYEMKMGKKITGIAPDVMNALSEYNWPGNIRELENLIERALILCRGNTLEYGDWVPIKKTAATNGKATAQKLEDIEREHITAVLKQTNWKVSGEKGAAKMLGLNATTLEARMKKLGIIREKK
jgi:formate hydrogenlyase transcriptional activator